MEVLGVISLKKEINIPIRKNYSFRLECDMPFLVLSILICSNFKKKGPLFFILRYHFVCYKGILIFIISFDLVRHG